MNWRAAEFVTFVFAYLLLSFAGMSLISAATVAFPLAEFYERLGFEMDVGIAEKLIVFFSVSSALSVFFVVFHRLKHGWPEQKNTNGGLVYMFVKLVVVLALVWMVFGALGENISRRNRSEYGGLVSALVGCLIMGGWVWVVNDFIGALFVKKSRGD